MNQQASRDPVLYVDCTSTFRGGLNTGVQRVVRALLSQKAVFEEVLQFEFVPICYQFNGFYSLDDAASITLETQDEYTPVDFRFKDIYFCPDAFWTMGMSAWFMFLKERGVSVAVIIYDLIPLVRPDFVDTAERINFESALLEVVNRSDILFCISDATRRDLDNFLIQEGLTTVSERCQVVPLAPALSQPAECVAICDGRLPETPFFLMVGTVEPRRGYTEAIAEFLQYRGAGGKASLLIVGKAGPASEDILRVVKDAKSSVVWLNDLNDGELLNAYKRALAVICASRIEGYGMSVSEGLSYNGLVLANRLPVFGEFAGALPHYFDIDRSGDLARLLLSVSDLKRSRASARLGSWQNTAFELATGLTEISHCHGRHKAIEITKNSREAVRWAHWILLGRACNSEDLESWLAYETVPAMLDAMRFEQRLPESPLTAESVRWLQLAINGRLGVGDDEVVFWQHRCGSIGVLRETLMHDQLKTRVAFGDDIGA